MGPYLVILCQLVFTVLLEGSVMVVWQYSKEALGYSVLVNLMTNPPLNIILLLMAGQGPGIIPTMAVRICLEILIVIIEAIAYMGMMKIDIKRALTISFVLNLVSFGVGEIFGVLGYWRVLDLILSL